MASSFAQGRIIFEHVRAFLEAAGCDLGDRSTWRVQDSANVATVEHRLTGARVRYIGSDPKRVHGLAPVLVLADEPAQWEATKRDAMRAALATAMGKIDDSRMIALGTRPADQSHWFARMLDGGAGGAVGPGGWKSITSSRSTVLTPPGTRRTCKPSAGRATSARRRTRMSGRTRPATNGAR